MEQAIAKTGRRMGWSESENKLLWETADEAQQQGLPLKAVFEQISRKRRKPRLPPNRPPNEASPWNRPPLPSSWWPAVT